MPLNRSEQKFFDLLAKREAENPSKPLDEQSIDDFRQPALMLIEFAGKPADVSKKDGFITARDGYQIPIRIFNADIKTPGSVFIIFPGGGYVMNTFEATAVAASRIAKFSRQKVIVVNYRLAPENPMPTSINDAWDATKYIATHPDEFQLDPKKLRIGGLSAGAHCAAVISYLAQNDQQLRIDHQVLLNGAYAPLLKRGDYEFKYKKSSARRFTGYYPITGGRFFRATTRVLSGTFATTILYCL